MLHGSLANHVNICDVDNEVHVHIFHVYRLYVNVVQPGSVQLAVNIILFDSVVVQLIFVGVGAVFVHVAVHHAQLLTHPLQSVIFIYLHVVHGSVSVTLVVIAVCHTIVAVHEASVYRWYVNGVHHQPGSVTLHVHMIALFSAIDETFVELAVGAKLVHVHVANTQLLQLHCTSVIV